MTKYHKPLEGVTEREKPSPPETMKVMRGASLFDQTFPWNIAESQSFGTEPAQKPDLDRDYHENIAVVGVVDTPVEPQYFSAYEEGYVEGRRDEAAQWRRDLWRACAGSLVLLLVLLLAARHMGYI